MSRNAGRKQLSERASTDGHATIAVPGNSVQVQTDGKWETGLKRQLIDVPLHASTQGSDQPSRNEEIAENSELLHTLNGWETGVNRHPLIVRLAYVECLPEKGGDVVVTTKKETYSNSPEAKRGGGGIEKYLERVWAARIQSGEADRRLIAKEDPSVIEAIKNFRKPKGDGTRRELPEHLRLPTISDAIDRIAATSPPRERPAHVDWALRERARRAKKSLTAG